MAEEGQAVAAAPTTERGAGGQGGRGAPPPEVGGPQPQRNMPPRGPDGKFATAMAEFRGVPAKPDPPKGELPPGVEDPADRVPEVPAMKPRRVQPGEQRPTPRATERNGDYSREDTRATERNGRGETAEPEAAEAPEQKRGSAGLRAFSERFGIAHEEAGEAMTLALDDFARIVESQSPAPGAAPTAGEGPPQARPAPQPSAPRPTAPAPSQAGSGQDWLSDQREVDAFISEFGDTHGKRLAAEFQTLRSVAAEVQQLRDDLKAQRMQGLSQQVDRFFASKVTGGFKELLGNSREGTANREVRQRVIQNAARYATDKQREGIAVELEDALEFAVLYEDRKRLEKLAREQGRQEVQQSVIQRHQTRDLIPSGAAGQSNGYGSETAFRGQIRSFLGGRR